MNKIFFYLILTSLSSCAYFINQFDEDVFKSNKINPLSSTEKTICEIKRPSFILLNDNKKLQISFTKFISSLSQSSRISFIDKAVLWSLLQMNSRPDLSSPSSKMQILIMKDNKEYYLNSYSEKTTTSPYLHALEVVLKKYKSNYSLLDLAILLDRKFSGPIFVNSEFSDFLLTHQNKITQNKTLKKSYIRGSDSLRVNERITKLKFAKLIRRYKSKKRKSTSFYKTGNFLFKNQRISTLDHKCNFDMNLYRSSVFLINPVEIKANTFGLKMGKDVFMATSSQKLDKITNVPGSHLFSGSSNTRGASVCSFQNRLKQQNVSWLISSNSRDPGQHLFHLTEYGLGSAKNPRDAEQLFKFSRHQFLKEPVRLVIESKRSSSEQLTKLLKLNIPIYNSKSLGKIWGYFQTPTTSSFILDDRHDGHLLCSKK